MSRFRLFLLLQAMLVVLMLPFQPDSAHAASTGNTAKEKACYNKVQNKVSWSKNPNTRQWQPQNINKLCKNVDNVNKRISCFKSEIRTGSKWDKATSNCASVGAVASNQTRKSAGSTSGAQCSAIYQAAWVSGKVYKYGYNSIPRISLSKAPSDIDCNRFAMLHDGTTYRLYFFKKGSRDTIYQFAFNRSSNKYEYGYNSIPKITIVGAPGSADTSSFAMLHDGSKYRLYLMDRSGDKIHQFVWVNGTTQYKYGYGDAIPAITISRSQSFPSGDWGMLHDGKDFRLYIADRRNSNLIYQFGYRSSDQVYRQGYNSIPLFEVKGMPRDASRDFAMLHDGSAYRHYRISKNN